MSKRHTDKLTPMRMEFMSEWRDLVENVLIERLSPVEMLNLCKTMLDHNADLLSRLKILDELVSPDKGVSSKTFTLKYNKQLFEDEKLLKLFKHYLRSKLGDLAKQHPSLMDRNAQQRFIKKQEQTPHDALFFEFQEDAVPIISDFASGLHDIYSALVQIHFLTVYAVSSKVYGYRHVSYTWLEEDLVARYLMAAAILEVPRQIKCREARDPIKLVGYTGIAAILKQIRNAVDALIACHRTLAKEDPVEAKTNELLINLKFTELDLGDDVLFYLRKEIRNGISTIWHVISDDSLASTNFVELKGDCAMVTASFLEQQMALSAQD